MKFADIANSNKIMFDNAFQAKKFYDNPDRDWYVDDDEYCCIDYRRIEIYTEEYQQ